MPDDMLEELERQLNPVGLEGQDPGLAAALHLGLKSNPDKEADVRRKAGMVGLDPELVRGSETVARKAEVDSLITGMDGYPKTRTLIANPSNAAIAHDATESLTAMEREGGFFSRIRGVATDSLDTVTSFGRDIGDCLLYTSPSSRDRTRSRMPSSA